MPIYNPNRGPLVKGIMVLGIIGSCIGIWNTGLSQYRDENPYAGMPDEFQTAMGEMGLQHFYEGEHNTKIEQMLLALDIVDTASATVITSNGVVYSVTVTLTGNGWKNVCKPLADRVRELYPGVDVAFYEWRGSNLDTIYAE